MAGKALTTQSLRETLFSTIDGVLEGSIDTKKAAAVANLADKVIKSADLEIKYSEHVSKMDAVENGVAPGPMMLADMRAADD